MVRRALKFHKFPVRGKADAQAKALASGRAKHPTEGTVRPDATKKKIGDAIRQNWKTLEPAELERLRVIAADRWNAIPEKRKAEILKKAAQGVRKTSTGGSKFEKEIYTALTAAGYRVSFHKEKIMEGTEMHLDLYLPEEGIGIEVDGPSHFYPIYGEEALVKRIEADNKKNGLLLTEGYILIRVCDFSRFHSSAAMREFNKKLVKLIEEIVSNPPTELKDRFFEISFGKPRTEDKEKFYGKTT